jgi:hypothetical protein
LVVADGGNRCIRRVDMDPQWPHTGNVTCAAGAACASVERAGDDDHATGEGEQRGGEASESESERRQVTWSTAMDKSRT